MFSLSLCLALWYFQRSGWKKGGKRWRCRGGQGEIKQLWLGTNSSPENSGGGWGFTFHWPASIGPDGVKPISAYAEENHWTVAAGSCSPLRRSLDSHSELSSAMPQWPTTGCWVFNSQQLYYSQVCVHMCVVAAVLSSCQLKLKKKEGIHTFEWLLDFYQFIVERMWKKHKTIKDIHVYFMFVNPLRTHVKFIISLYVFHKLWPAVVAVVHADPTTKVNLNNILKMEKLMQKLGNFNPEWVTESSMFLPSVKGGLFIHFSMTWFLSSKNIICAVILMFEFAQRERWREQRLQKVAELKRGIKLK